LIRNKEGKQQLYDLSSQVRIEKAAAREKTRWPSQQTTTLPTIRFTKRADGLLRFNWPATVAVYASMRREVKRKYMFYNGQQRTALAINRH
jgi:hypothetical protein